MVLQLDNNLNKCRLKKIFQSVKIPFLFYTWFLTDYNTRLGT